jgi:hypothetical protein
MVRALCWITVHRPGLSSTDSPEESSQDRQSAEVVAAASLGTMYYVIGHNHSDLWGSTREGFALKAAAADVGGGPAAELLRDAGREVVERHTGAAGKDLRDKGALRGLGLQQVGGVLPVLGQLSPVAAQQVRAWILRIAEQVAEASHDVGETEEISDAERRAIAAVDQVLTA